VLRRQEEKGEISAVAGEPRRGFTRSASRRLHPLGRRRERRRDPRLERLRPHGCTIAPRPRRQGSSGSAGSGSTRSSSPTGAQPGHRGGCPPLPPARELALRRLREGDVRTPLVPDAGTCSSRARHDRDARSCGREDRDDLDDDVGGGALAAMTLQVEVGPETRALIERLAATVIVQVELGPKTRELIEEFSRQGEEPQAGDAPSAR
jgi:hypothetical protein